MGLTKIESEVQALLAETIIALCRNTLKFDSEVSVEGLLGVTLDKQEIFLLNIKESIRVSREGNESGCVEKDGITALSRESDVDSSLESRSVASSRKRRRKRHHPQQILDVEKRVNESDDDILEQSSPTVDGSDATDVVANIKQEIREDPDVLNISSDVASDIGNNNPKLLDAVKTEQFLQNGEDQSCGFLGPGIDHSDSLLTSNLPEVFVADPLALDYYSNHLRFHGFPTHPFLAGLYSAQVLGELSQDSEQFQRGEHLATQRDTKPSGPDRKCRSSPSQGTPSMPLVNPQEFSTLCANQNSAEQQRTCHLCNKMFPSRSHRAVHMRTHTGERPFRCPLCSKDFNQRQVMYRHMRNIHRVPPDTTRSFSHRTHGAYTTHRTHRGGAANPFLSPPTVSATE